MKKQSVQAVQAVNLPQFYINVPYNEWLELKATIKKLKEKLIKQCEQVQAKEFLSPKEVCEILKISRSTFEKQIKSQLLPTEHTPRKRSKIPRTAIDTMLNSQRIENLLFNGKNKRKQKFEA